MRASSPSRSRSSRRFLMASGTTGSSATCGSTARSRRVPCTSMIPRCWRYRRQRARPKWLSSWESRSATAEACTTRSSSSAPTAPCSARGASSSRRAPSGSCGARATAPAARARRGRRRPPRRPHLRRAQPRAARYALQAQQEQVHVASYPDPLMEGRPFADRVDAAVRHYAAEGQCFVLNATGFLDDDARRRVRHARARRRARSRRARARRRLVHHRARRRVPRRPAERRGGHAHRIPRPRAHPLLQVLVRRERPPGRPTSSASRSTLAAGAAAATSPRRRQRRGGRRRAHRRSTRHRARFRRVRRRRARRRRRPRPLSEELGRRRTGWASA